jgi:hypothetical protein
MFCSDDIIDQSFSFFIQASFVPVVHSETNKMKQLEKLNLEDTAACALKKDEFSSHAFYHTK